MFGCSGRLVSEDRALWGRMYLLGVCQLITLRSVISSILIATSAVQTCMCMRR